MTAPLPSTTMTHALKRQKYADDRSPPGLYELIKARLPNPLNGPTSITIATSSVGSTQGLPGPAGYHTQYRYHSAIVKGFAVDSESKLLVIDVWPVPAYSNATAEGYVSSTNWVMAQPIRDHHIPMPCLGDSVAPTPEAFGEPLNLGGYKDWRPSWVLLQPQRVHVPFNNSVNAPSFLYALSSAANNNPKTSGNASIRPYIFPTPRQNVSRAITNSLRKRATTSQTLLL